MNNTSTISLLLYGALVLLTSIVIVIAFRYIKRKEYKNEQIDKMIDLFKYAIVSIGLATISLIVTDMFKERDRFFTKVSGWGNMD